MPKIPRSEILDRLRDKVDRGLPIIGGGAGTGLSAKLEEAAGIDLIVIYNSGRYRMAGRGSLAGLMAYGNANDLVLDPTERSLYVVTDGDPAIIGIPIGADGSAGTPHVIARDLSPLDGVAVDPEGNIYVSEILRSEISVFSPDGAQRVVIATSQTAPLVNPTSLVYRRGTVCAANLGWNVTPEPRSIACISGFRRPEAAAQPTRASP